MNPPPDEIDSYREDNPDRQSQLLADLMNWEPEPESMLSPPASKTVQCVSCHADFEAEPQIFRGRWVYPCLCSEDCGAITEEIRTRTEPANIKSFECPKCGIRKNVEPLLDLVVNGSTMGNAATAARAGSIVIT